MISKLDKYQVKRFSRQIVLKNVGALGQKKILNSKVLIIGMGGLGCPAAEFLIRAGVGFLGIVDHDKVDLSNIHRQSLFDSTDLNKPKVRVALKKLNKINPKAKINTYQVRLDKNNLRKIIKNFDFIIDGSDNFETKFLINDFCIRYKKILVAAAISKFDGHVFTFDFKNKKYPCLRCFYQEKEIFDDVLDCENEGVLSTVAGIVGIIQANEVLKQILDLGKNLNGFILILDLLNLRFRKVKLNKQKKCLCG